MDDEAWKSIGEDWSHPIPPHRGFGPDESCVDYRPVDGFHPGAPGQMSMEQMMQHRMGEFGALRRGDPRAIHHAPGTSDFYNGHTANGAGFPAVKDELGRHTVDMMRAMNEGPPHGMWIVCACQFCTRLSLLSIFSGLASQAPNLANSLANTTLGNYLTVLNPVSLPWSPDTFPGFVCTAV